MPMFRNTASQAVIGLAFWLCCEAALPGSFGVSPIRLTLTSEQPSGMLTVSNQSDEETVVQLDARAWSQQDGTDVLEAMEDLIVVPPLFTLQPGGTQVVRIGLRRPPLAGGEQTYRLLLREVPPPPPDGFNGLQVALNLSLPIFAQPANVSGPELNWDLEVSGPGAVELSLRNDGDAHAQLRSLRLTGVDGEVIEGKDLPAYLLRGQAIRWALDMDAEAGSRWKLTAETRTGPVEAELVLEPRGTKTLVLK